MVDFNNESTISKPPKEVVALIIIEKIYNFLEADEDYAKKKLQGGGVSIAIPRARLRNLFLMSHALLKRGLDEPDYNGCVAVCMDVNRKDVEPDDLMEAFGHMMTVLDKVGLTKLDTKPVYNRNSIEQSNKAQGYN